MAPAKVAADPGPAAETLTAQAYKTPFSSERARGIAAQQLTLADGRQLEYFTDGSDSKPAVFLIHGQWNRGNVWIGPPRTDTFLVCPTRPNYGTSTKHPGYSYETFADDGACRRSATAPYHPYFTPASCSRALATLVGWQFGSWLTTSRSSPSM